jgi:hypothetical protein
VLKILPKELENKEIKWKIKRPAATHNQKYKVSLVHVTIYNIFLFQHVRSLKSII